MLDTILAAIAAFILLLLLPSRAQCPVGWSLGEGIRRSGDYACYSPVPRNCGEPRGPYEKPCPKSTVIRRKIYCTNGMSPIVVDERTVGCQRVPVPRT